MNDRSWLWTVALVVLALFAYDWLRGQPDDVAGGVLRSSRWGNIPAPRARSAVYTAGLAPGGSSGSSPAVDSLGGKGCGCS
jgi:hypothetical protein